ncbi:MAG: putative rane protein [Herbinix sp.]|jgi:membrane protein|nr:putative rane protein [Herbinix sp.]
MIKSTYKLVNLFSHKVRDDCVAASSAQAAFFIIISFFPFIMLLLSIVQYLPFQESTLLRTFTQIFPKAVNSLIVSVITEIYHKASGTIVSITAISALWSASKGFLAIMKGLNSVYGINETRHYILLRVISTFYTLIFAIMLIATMILFVFGNRLYLWIEQRIPILRDLALLIISLRTFLGLLILLVFFLIIYIVIPNRDSRMTKELPGAIVCAAGWMGFSYAYSYYIDNFANYSSTYGSLTAIVLFMLWMYFCMYILFIGAEINMMFENKEVIKKVKLLYRKRDSEIEINNLK